MNKSKPLKIAYLCDLTPLESWSYSSGNSHIYNSLKSHVGDVEILDVKWSGVEPLRRLLNKLPEAINLRARWRLHLFLAKYIAKTVNQQLATGQFDVLFCAYSFHSLARLKIPENTVVVFAADATPSTYKNSMIGASFGSYLSISRWLDPLVLRSEKRILGGTDLNLWPSDWQRLSAIQTYNLSDEKSITIPWGANIPPLPENDVAPAIHPNRPINLVLLGRDWQAKGGPKTVAILDILTAQNVKAHLTVIGCVPPEQDIRTNMTIHAQLDKSNSHDLEIFERVLASSHFMVMPSFEAYGFAFCEASAYGLPSLCLDVGGVPVFEGVNGHRFALEAPSSEYVDKIRYYLAAPDQYTRLRQSSRELYETTLNWEAWGTSLYALLQERVRLKKT